MTDAGLYCREGDFHVDPWRPVPRAIVTHAHSDHACRGSQRYLTLREGVEVLRARMGSEALIDALPAGDTVELGRTRVSLHPAGHILGSAQVRVELAGETWVVSGDYKVEADRTCSPFEPIRCDVFISESTFGLPIYRWPREAEVFDAINSWWASQRDEGRACVLFGYALGKAQRILSGLDPSIGPIFTHGALEPLIAAYRASGIQLPPTARVSEQPPRRMWAGAMILAPPSAHGSPWMRKFGPTSTGYASGWMRIRGTRRRRSVDRGFVLSDHADWPGLLGAIEATGAERVILTHGYSAVLARWLIDRGTQAGTMATRYLGERAEVSDVPADPAEADSDPDPDT